MRRSLLLLRGNISAPKHCHNHYECRGVTSDYYYRREPLVCSTRFAASLHSPSYIFFRVLFSFLFALHVSLHLRQSLPPPTPFGKVCRHPVLPSDALLLNGSLHLFPLICSFIRCLKIHIKMRMPWNVCHYAEFTSMQIRKKNAPFFKLISMQPWNHKLAILCWWMHRSCTVAYMARLTCRFLAVTKAPNNAEDKFRHLPFWLFSVQLLQPRLFWDQTSLNTNTHSRPSTVPWLPYSSLHHFETYPKIK